MRNFINSLANLFFPFLLRSPLHIFLSGSILLITFTGRKSGKVYSTPVQYIRDGDTLTVFTYRNPVWWHNLRDGATVELLVRGESHKGTASTTLAEENESLMLEQMAKLYARMTDDRRSGMVKDMVMLQIELAA